MEGKFVVFRNKNKIISSCSQASEDASNCGAGTNYTGP